jgi:dihydropteroate synthase
LLFLQIAMRWITTRFDIHLTEPRVMGIVNVTPDSFSDGGRHASTGAALAHAERLIAQGAHMLDIGGESTRPGSPAVPLDEELARVLPVLREAVKLGVPVSIDTYKPQVMQAALDLGVDIVNDIWALRREGAVDVVAAHPRAGVCLMHMHRDPQTMQVAPMQGDVLPVVRAFLRERAQALTDRGVARERIVFDPGVGFGKTVPQNFSLLARRLVAQVLPRRGHRHRGAGRARRRQRGGRAAGGGPRRAHRAGARRARDGRGAEGLAGGALSSAAPDR